VSSATYTSPNLAGPGLQRECAEGEPKHCVDGHLTAAGRPTCWNLDGPGRHDTALHASQTTQSSYACTAKLAHGTTPDASYTGKSNGWSLTAALSLAVN